MKRSIVAPLLIVVTAVSLHAQATELPLAITAPKTPLASESATAKITKFSFIAYGDTRGRHDGTELQAEHTLVVEAMLRTIKAASTGGDPIKFVLQSGDAVVNGRDAKALTVSYVPIINRLTTEAGVPYFFTSGNHDVNGATDRTDVKWQEGTRNLFAANRNLLPAEGTPHRLTGYPTYGFGYGNTWFLALDSNIADDEPQFQWVKTELEQLDRTRYVNVVVFYHHPAFSSGPHGGSTIEKQQQAMRTKYHPLFRAHHVKLLLAGHEHLFEHWVERYTDATGPHRMDQVVTGGGGAPLYGYRGEPELRDYLAANAKDKVALEHLAKPDVEPGANPFHFVVVHVDGEKLSLEVVAADWGRGFAPYRSAGVTMSPPPTSTP
jgi:hypothetical protein